MGFPPKPPILFRQSSSSLPERVLHTFCFMPRTETRPQVESPRLLLFCWFSTLGKKNISNIIYIFTVAISTLSEKDILAQYYPLKYATKILLAGETILFHRKNLIILESKVKIRNKHLCLILIILFKNFNVKLNFNIMKRTFVIYLVLFSTTF